MIDDCRGLGTVEGDRACNRRQAILNRLDKLGWCWGPAYALEASQHWMRYKTDPDYEPGEYAKPYFTEEEIRNSAANQEN